MSDGLGVDPARLSDAKIAALKAASERYEVRDRQVPGLRVVVFPSGAKSFVYRYRHLGRYRKLTIGGAEMGIEKARKLARKASGQVADDRDPAEDKKAKREAAKDRIEVAVAEFMAKHLRTKNGAPIRLTTRIETGRLLGLKPGPKNPGEWIETGNGVLARWSGKPLHAITKGVVIDMLDDIAADAPVKANRTLAALRTFCRWCIARDKLSADPTLGVNDPSPEAARDRVLEDRELAALWRAAEAEGYPFGRMVQMLILTGCRRDEVREAAWSEIDMDGERWTIPASRTKNGHGHVLPLSGHLAELLRELPRISGRGLLFTTTGGTPISGQSKAKERLHAAMAKELGAEPQRWTLHDCRRTFATGLQRLGFQVEVAEACLNHLSGTRAGVAGIYGRHDYANEKLQAFAAWGRHVAHVATGKSALREAAR
jgi:integrase